jgi:hypothetical protein
MARTYDAIDENLAAFMRAQHVFFVATAPLDANGHVNVSPKGLDTFTVLDEHAVAYLDLTGSGAETIAHLRENGRITIMFCAFDGPPRILRLHGRGDAVMPRDPRYAELASRFPSHPGARAVVRVDVERISTSCGYAVPLLDFRAERDVLDTWTAKKGEEGLERYRADKNRESVDGLPAIDPE